MNIQEIMRSSQEYAEYVQEVVVMSVSDLQTEIMVLRQRRDELNNTIVIDERHVKIIENQMDDMLTKLQIIRSIEPVIRGLSLYRAQPIKNTFQFLSQQRWVVKVTYHNTSGLALGVSNAVQFYPLEEVRALKFYLNVHEDDFVR